MSGQKQNKGSGFGGGSGGGEQPEGAPQQQRHDALKAVKKADQALGKVNVVYGAHDIDMDLAGFSVEEIQFSLRDVLNVDMDAQAYVDGNLVENKGNFKLQSGQRLEFMKEAGQKGGS
jgi:hypothetical protein